MNKEIVSNCCGVSPWGELDGPHGICGDCKEHCEFEMLMPYINENGVEETLVIPLTN